MLCRKNRVAFQVYVILVLQIYVILVPQIYVVLVFQVYVILVLQIYVIFVVVVVVVVVLVVVVVVVVVVIVVVVLVLVLVLLVRLVLVLVVGDYISHTIKLNKHSQSLILYIVLREMSTRLRHSLVPGALTDISRDTRGHSFTRVEERRGEMCEKLPPRGVGYADAFPRASRDRVEHQSAGDEAA